MLIEVDICSQTGAVQEMLKKVQVTKDKKEHSWLLYTTGWHVFLRRKCYVKSVKDVEIHFISMKMFFIMLVGHPSVHLCKRKFNLLSKSLLTYLLIL